MSGGPEQGLDRKLIEAHGRGDGDTLTRLYRQAAELAEQAGDVDRACFFYVHAYVFALEAGHRDADAIRARLRHFGRED
ncbi:MAG TPA: hypothetical protein VK862_01585 [Afifellaceae bacterium]|nr:hypothetical protein [Afifellaceae bacterium]